MSDVRRTIEAVWRIESVRLIAALARLTGDLGRAEDLAQDALVAALERWPRDGVPPNPGGWLMTTARRRAIDEHRRDRVVERARDALGRAAADAQGSAPDPADAVDDVVEDDVLRLMFATCHPVLSVEARVALTLRVLGGLTTAEIARAFLVPEATIAQRIVRAKRALRAARVPFEVPGRAELPERFASVLQVVYLNFNEGYSATSGERWVRPALCDEAMRLGRMLVHLAPDEPEVLGLLALMELQASRLRARVAADGSAVPLLEQDRGRWDHVLIRRGLAGLARIHALGGALGPYALQAEIAACHARAGRPEDTDWTRIVALYDALAGLTGSPVVALNRAVAVGMAYGPVAGLEALAAVSAAGGLERYHLLPAARGELLERLGDGEAAGAAFADAAALAPGPRERDALLERAARARAAARG